MIGFACSRMSLTVVRLDTLLIKVLRENWGLLGLRPVRSLLGDVHNRVYYVEYTQFIVDNKLIRTYGCYFLHRIYVIYCSAYV